MPERSIFIAGAGPVGLAAAVELTRRGFAPRIIDPDPSPSPQSRALAVNSRTLDLLEASGVTEQLLAAGNRIRKLVVRRNLHVVGEIDLKDIPHRFNFLLAIPQSETESILSQTLARLGIALERQKGLTGFVTGNAMQLALSTGETVSTDILVGADGAHSLVRKTLGIGFPGETGEETFGLTDVSLSNWPFPFDTVVVTILDTHLAPFIPLSEGYGRFISTRGDCLNSLPADARVGRVDWETDFRISYRQAEIYQKGNVFLAGDAAHIHSPVGGRGMNLGIEDACWLAWLIEQNRQLEYSDLRHPAGAQVLRYTHRFTEFARARGRTQDLAIRLALPLLSRAPSLRRRLFAMVTGLDTSPPAWLP